MITTLSKPSDVQAPAREAGGDNEVPRDSKGRPRIKVTCQSCTETPGKMPSPKTGKPIQCSKCKGKVEKEVSYTRTTTYIDVIEDKSNLQKWGERMVLVGLERDRTLLNSVADLFEASTATTEECKHTAAERRLGERGDCEPCDAKSAKDELNRKAQVAKNLAGAEDKADKGTHLHGLSELVDEGELLPVGIEFGDVIDMDSYRRATEMFSIVHMEKLVVQDDLKIGGTPDRVSTFQGEPLRAAIEEHGAEWGMEHGICIIKDQVHLVAPNGMLIGPDDLIITDLKTGTVEYGALKMAMQLAIYSRSELYDHETGERTPLGKIRQDWGIIMHVAAGTGVCDLYWADLTLGWEAVEVAGLVRALRGKRNALVRMNVGQSVS